MRVLLMLAGSCLLLGCAVSGSVGTGMGSSSSVSRAWGIPSAAGVLDDGDDLEQWCRDQAQRRLVRGGNGSFRWKSRRSSRGDLMQFSGTVHAGERGLQVSCSAYSGQPADQARIEFRPLAD